MDAECTGQCPTFTLKAIVGSGQSEEIIFCMKTRNSGFSKLNIYTELLDRVRLSPESAVHRLTLTSRSSCSHILPTQ